MRDAILINLGIDFGTRFTKVCARADGVGVAICDFSGKGTDGALLPSILEMAADGRLRAPEAGADVNADRALSYLKMALAERGQLDIGRELPPDLPNTPEIEQALSALFLASTLARARRWVEANWKIHIGDRDILWSANVGLPVEYCDSPTAAIFQKVLAIAWDWSERGFTSVTLDAVIEDYARCQDQIDATMSVCQAYPEIAAAVLSFAISRSAAPGIYICFDIGGGTLDGVAFNLRRERGEVTINFYSGHVAPLGLDWIAEDAAVRVSTNGEREDRDAIKSLLLELDSGRALKAFKRFVQPVRKLVGNVIWEAKSKDGRDWRSGSFQDFSTRRTIARSSQDHELRPLSIFLGGGGVSSPFYQAAISGTYRAFKHYMYGIPPYQLIEIPSPPDLQRGSIPPDDYHRFLVAYGLSVPFGEGPEVQLPSAFDVILAPAPRPEKQAPSHLDSKDIYD